MTEDAAQRARGRHARLTSPRGIVTIAGRTAAKAWRDRILGLSAEAGFWQLLSLPPLLLALVAVTGYIGAELGTDTLEQLRTVILDAAGKVLSPEAVNDAVAPTLTTVLKSGRADIASVGFVLSLWSGSSAMATFVNTITIAYGQREHRGAVHSRLLALGLYLGALLFGALLIPVIIVGPGALARLLPGTVARTVVHEGAWPVVAFLGLIALMTLYHLSPPRRYPWRRALPGALLALAVWVGGSFGLRYYFVGLTQTTGAYGALAAPIAVLLFNYVTALAVLLGAEFNAQIELSRPPRADGPADGGNNRRDVGPDGSGVPARGPRDESGPGATTRSGDVRRVPTLPGSGTRGAGVE